MTYSRILTVFIVVLLAGLGWTQAETTEQGTPDTEISLREASVFENPTPATTVENQTDPGEAPLYPRPNHVAPPVISHGINDFLPITSDSNMCVDCHEVEEKIEGEATPMPPSHYTDLRRSPETVGDELVAARYFCVACHIALTEATPLRENTFEIPQDD